MGPANNNIATGWRLSLVLRGCVWVGLVSLLSVGACVQPPSVAAPAVIPPKELSLVSHISQGKGFVSQGRYDLAEIEYREALVLAPEVGSLYSDLGYILSAQQRYSEAVSFFEITLRFAPGDISALTNLAATYYKMGELEQSIAIYEVLLSKHEIAAITEFGVPARKNLTPVEVVDIYRNMSIVYNLLGDYGEAACLSLKAAQSSTDSNQLSQHARLLMSMERSHDAVDFLAQVVAQEKELIPPPLMLDFGVALLEQGNIEAAKQALEQLALFSGVSRADDSDAQVVLVLIAQRNGEDTESLMQVVVENEPSICDSSITDRRRYWPQAVVNEAASLIQAYCDESRKSNFSPAKFFSR